VQYRPGLNYAQRITCTIHWRKRERGGDIEAWYFKGEHCYSILEKERDTNATRSHGAIRVSKMLKKAVSQLMGMKGKKEKQK